MLSTGMLLPRVIETVSITSRAPCGERIPTRMRRPSLVMAILFGRPNNIAITKDGRRILVGIRSPQGALDVIDTVSMTRGKSIPVDSIHNVYVTPDGKYAVSGSLEGQSVTVTDLQTDKIAWKLNFDHPVRPMAFEVHPDGSTRRIFVQLSNFNGFAVVDFAKRSEVAR